MTTSSSHPTALVIAGAGGIGDALARRLVQRGTRTVVTSRSPEKAAEAASRSGAIPTTADVLDEASLAAAVALASDGGKLGALAYCVGSIPLKPLARTTAADMLDAFHVNTLGAFLAVRLAADALKSGSGAVVLFSSIAARQGFVNHAAIATAKGGIEGLTVALAAELAPAVRVNAIAPSLTDTPLAKPLTGNPKVLEGIAAMHPIPRIGSAEEMAALAAFMLSAEAGWISGQILAVDGGRSSLRVGRS